MGEGLLMPDQRACGRFQHAPDPLLPKKKSLPQNWVVFQIIDMEEKNESMRHSTPTQEREVPHAFAGEPSCPPGAQDRTRGAQHQRSLGVVLGPPGRSSR